MSATCGKIIQINIGPAQPAPSIEERGLRKSKRRVWADPRHDFAAIPDADTGASNDRGDDMQYDTSQRPQGGRRRRGLRFLPFVLFAVIALIVLRDRVPFVADWMEKTLQPNEWRARQACLQAALDSAGVPDFARVVARGNIDHTRNGFYVSEVVVGEMGETGEEVRFRFSCYLDAAGGVVKTHQDR